MEPLHSLLIDFMFYFFKYTLPPHTPLKSLTAERGKLDSAPPSPASRADDSLALSYSTHSTFPMQIWRHPAAHLKRYARHSLPSPTHPPTQAPDRVAALRYMTPLFYHKWRHIPPPSTSSLPPNATSRRTAVQNCWRLPISFDGEVAYKE